MTSYEKAGEDMQINIRTLLALYPEHEVLRNAKVRFDVVFAYPEYDGHGEPKGPAMVERGRKILGKTRKIPLKDRALGRGDVEICLDGHFWDKVGSEADKMALLDHELHHISVKTSGIGTIQTDDLERPLIQLRQHDVEVGWFAVIARRHGRASQEVQQAKWIMDNAGQLFWPDLFKDAPIRVTEDHIENAVKNFRAVVQAAGGEVTMKTTNAPQT